MPEASDDPPVTGVLDVLVPRGQEGEFEERLRDLAEASMRQPGQLGLSTLRPSSPGEPCRVIHKSDRRSNDDRWHAVDERQVLFAVRSTPSRRSRGRSPGWRAGWSSTRLACRRSVKSTVVCWLGI